jgi:hypothetical protein
MPLTTRAKRLGPVALVTVAALITASTVFITGNDDANREKNAFATEKQIDRAELDHIDHDQPILFLTTGHAALTFGANAIFRLVEAGVPVRVDSFNAVFLGRHRKEQRGVELPALVLRTSTGPLPPLPGKVLVDKVFDPEYTSLLDELTAVARRSKVELTPDAYAIIDRDYSPAARPFIRLLYSQLESDPRTTLARPQFLALLQKVVLRSPVFDMAKIRRLQSLIHRDRLVVGEERVQLSLLTPSELRVARPRL